MIVLYYFLSLYYRRTSVETKRLGSLMRSAFYSSYSGLSLITHNEIQVLTVCLETLAGLATIRAFREQVRYGFTRPDSCRLTSIKFS